MRFFVTAFVLLGLFGWWDWKSRPEQSKPGVQPNFPAIMEKFHETAKKEQELINRLQLEQSTVIREMGTKSPSPNLEWISNLPRNLTGKSWTERLEDGVCEWEFLENGRAKMTMTESDGTVFGVNFGFTLNGTQLTMTCGNITRVSEVVWIDDHTVQFIDKTDSRTNLLNR